MTGEADCVTTPAASFNKVVRRPERPNVSAVAYYPPMIGWPFAAVRDSTIAQPSVAPHRLSHPIDLQPALFPSSHRRWEQGGDKPSLSAGLGGGFTPPERPAITMAASCSEHQIGNGCARKPSRHCRRRPQSIPARADPGSASQWSPVAVERSGACPLAGQREAVPSTCPAQPRIAAGLQARLALTRGAPSVIR